MKDRIVQYPNRIKLTAVDADNGIFDVERYSGTITQEGTKLNKNTLLKDETASKFGLNSDATPDDVLNEIADNGVLEVGDIKLSLKQQGANFIQCNGQEISYDPAFEAFLATYKNGSETMSSEYFHPTYDGEYLVYVDISAKKIWTYSLVNGDLDDYDLDDDSFWDNNTIVMGDADRVNGYWYIFGAHTGGGIYTQMLKVASLEDIDIAQTSTFDDVSLNYIDTQIMRYTGMGYFEFFYEKLVNPHNKVFKLTINTDMTNSVVDYTGSVTSKQRYYNWTHCNQRCYFNEDSQTIYYEVVIGGKYIREKMLSATAGNFYVDGTLVYNDVIAFTKIGDDYYIGRTSGTYKTSDFVTFTLVNTLNEWKANYTEPFGSDLNYVASDKKLCDTPKQKMPTITYGWMRKE